MNDERLTDELEIRDLLRRAGPRPTVPADHLASIREAAHREWSRSVGPPASTPARPALRWAAAVAATLLVALAAAWWWGRGSAPAAPLELAEVATVAGGLSLILPGADRAAEVSAGRSLPAGSELTTAATGESRGGAALAWAAGQSVRLAPGSRVRLVSPQRLTLLAGAVYVDSGEGKNGPPPIAVETPLGTVTEIGTRFATHLDEGEGTLRVRVRHGRVELAAEGGSHLATGGEELTLDRQGTLRRAAVETFGANWAWVEDTAPGFELEGARLDAYLDWISYETGLRIAFASPELARSAKEVRLQGARSLQGVTPRESLEAVLPASGLAWEIAGGELRLERAAP